MRIRTIGWRRKPDLLIDVRINDLAKLIAYVNTGCAPVPRVDERTTEGFNWDEVSIDISGDAARVGRSNRLMHKQAGIAALLRQSHHCRAPLIRPTQWLMAI